MRKRMDINGNLKMKKMKQEIKYNEIGKKWQEMIKKGHIKLVSYKLENETPCSVKKVIAVDEIGKNFLKK